MRRFLTLLLAVFLTITANAQVDSLPSQTLNEVQIILTQPVLLQRYRQTYQITTITEEDIKTMPVNSTVELLQYIAGVDLRQRGPMGAQADIQIQGSTFEQVLVLIDGVPMRDPQTGHHQLNIPVNIQSIQSIQVYKGNMSMVYGPNAIAGAVDIITKRPGTAASSASLSVGTTDPLEGSELSNPIAARLSFDVHLGKANAGHRISGELLDSEGYRFNSAAQQIRLHYGGSIVKDLTWMRWNLGGIQNEFGANSFYAAPYDRKSFEQVDTYFGDFTYNWYKNKWSIRPTVYYRYNHDDYLLNIDNPNGYHNNHYTTASGASVMISRYNKLGDLYFTVGERAEIIRSNNLGHRERFFTHLILAQKFKVRPSFDIQVGVNAQYNPQFGWQLFPAINASGSIRKVDVFLNSGIGVRNPTFTEYYYSDAANTGNENLRSETGRSVTGGFRYYYKNISFEASGFVREVVDLIDYVRESTQEKWRPENFNSAMVRGGDASIFYHFTEGKKNLAITSFMGGITYLDSRISQNTAFSKYQLDHFRWQAVMRASFKTGPIAHAIGYRYGERITGNSYNLYDYRISFSHNKWSVAADLINAFNTAYIESGFVPMPGRQWRLTGSYTF